MKSLIIVLLVLVAVAVVIKKLRAARSRTPQDWPVFARPVLTEPERLLYRCLVEALPGHIVLAQVVLSSFIRPHKNTDFYRIFNAYSRMSGDFVVCTPDLRAVAVIELDDTSHERADRQAADARKSAILQAAGVPLYRYSVKSLPSVAELRRSIVPAIAA